MSGTSPRRRRHAFSLSLSSWNGEGMLACTAYIEFVAVGRDRITLPDLLSRTKRMSLCSNIRECELFWRNALWWSGWDCRAVCSISTSRNKSLNKIFFFFCMVFGFLNTINGLFCKVSVTHCRMFDSCLEAAFWFLLRLCTVWLRSSGWIFALFHQFMGCINQFVHWMCCNFL